MMRQISFLGAATIALIAAMPAQAQVSGRELTIYGDDKCPRDTICVRAPESDRYRIPETLRKTENTPGRESWADRAASVDGVGASGIGSCSNVGAGGQSGCSLQKIRRAKASSAETAS